MTRLVTIAAYNDAISPRLPIIHEADALSWKIHLLAHPFGPSNITLDWSLYVTGLKSVLNLSLAMNLGESCQIFILSHLPCDQC